MKNKGFTLIELLAVIIILGILMIIAVPSVTKYINDSRKNGYISTAKEIAISAKNLVYDKNPDMDDLDTTYYIDGKCLNVDNTYKSPYGEFEKAYVVVTVEDNTHEYFWFSVDETGTGIKKLTNVEKLDETNIEEGINASDITPTIGIDKRSKIVVIDGENCEKREENILKVMNSKTGKIRSACPSTYTQTIYWTIENNKLTISDSEVTGSESGSFAGNSTDPVPWKNSANLSSISSVEVVGTVAPTSTNRWFSHVGDGSQSMDVNLEGLNVCHVTDMGYMFESFALSVPSFNLNLDDWETSNVTTMYAMFYNAGQNSTSFSLSLNGWDTRSVTNMGLMFSASGGYAQSYILHLNGWDTRNLVSMNTMFASAGFMAKNIDLDLSDWDTSNVTNINNIFSGVGYNADSFKINISGWNMSKVKNISNMFSYSGGRSTDYSIIIPRTNGNGVNNTSSLIYGKDTTYSATPPNGATFILTE